MRWTNRQLQPRLQAKHHESYYLHSINHQVSKLTTIVSKNKYSLFKLLMFIVMEFRNSGKQLQKLNFVQIHHPHSFFFCFLNFVDMPTL